jgi:hypothetical protein
MGEVKSTQANCFTLLCGLRRYLRWLTQLGTARWQWHWVRLMGVTLGLNPLPLRLLPHGPSCVVAPDAPPLLH